MTDRKRTYWFVLILFLPLSSPGQSGLSPPTELPENYVLWNAAVVDAAADRLEQSLGDKALVWETVGNYSGHSVYLVLRGRTSRAEIHETESDVQISIRGRATSIVGGTLINAESLPRKQQRGTSIEGGTRQELTPGDVMHIPPGAAHQLLIGPEENYLYLLIKIDEEPLQ
ncbi:MAG: hypothetical protein ACR2Q3_20095 [Woeseiaceae bacterium]